MALMACETKGYSRFCLAFTMRKADSIAVRLYMWASASPSEHHQYNYIDLCIY